jgi:hypothetical protein
MEIRGRGYCYPHPPMNLMRDYCNKFTDLEQKHLELGKEFQKSDTSSVN